MFVRRIRKPIPGAGLRVDTPGQGVARDRFARAEWADRIGLCLAACFCLLVTQSACRPGGDQEKPIREVSNGKQPDPVVESRIPAPPDSSGRFTPEIKAHLLKTIPRPMFEENAESLGVTFRHRADPELQSRRARLSIPMGMAGGGVSAGDYDGDGAPDLYFAGIEGGRLYRNEQGTRFSDATEASGLRLGAESRAGYFIDYDNDGDLDLFVTCVMAANRLFRNEGHGRFVDVTEAMGFDRHHDMTHEAVWFDLDNDGWLDVYTAGFGRWSEGAVPIVGRQNHNGDPNRLYHHRVEGERHYFEEIGGPAGVDDRGWTHCVGAWDINQDDRMDLVSLNDFAQARFYRNLGDGRFVEWSSELGIEPAYNGMNFTVMDLDRDGRFEAYVSEISHPVNLENRQLRYREAIRVAAAAHIPIPYRLTDVVNNRLYSDNGRGRLVNRHADSFEPVDAGWAWDGSALDYENDGDLDFLLLNGTESVPPRLQDERRARHLAQAGFIRLFADDTNRFFVSEQGFMYDVSEICEISFPGNSRGSAFLDFDSDGDLDIAVTGFGDRARLFRNVQPRNHGWIRFRLHGTRSNRNAVGARVSMVDSLGRTQHAMVVSRSGFLSQNPFELHFGLGEATEASRVRVHWPSGLDQILGPFEGRRIHDIEEEK